MPESPKPVASLAPLRCRVAQLEGRRAPIDDARFATGHEGIDGWLDGGLAKGRLHEVMTQEGEDAGSLAGFAAMLALRAGEGRPLLWLRTEHAEKKSGRLYATGLGEIGLDGSALLLGLVADDAALLRTASDAARCAGLGALMVECWGNPKQLDLTATRRLMLAAEHSGVTVLLLRMAARESPSVAETRWRVTPAPSAALAANAPGAPVFDVELLRRRAGPADRTWRVEWNREHRVFQVPDERGAALFGAVLPLAAS